MEGERGRLQLTDAASGAGLILQQHRPHHSLLAAVAAHVCVIRNERHTRPAWCHGHYRVTKLVKYRSLRRDTNLIDAVALKGC